MTSPQGSPFGTPRGQAPAAPAGGVFGWIFAKQAEFYRQFSGLIRAAKADGSAAWSLFGLAFLYGVFHAAGPGHGKAVISSYLVANEETWRRGVVRARRVGAAASAGRGGAGGHRGGMLTTAATMNSAVNVIETASYADILIGFAAPWVKGRGFIKAWQALNRPALVGAPSRRAIMTTPITITTIMAAVATMIPPPSLTTTRTIIPY
jgi:nickel/cobalt exporter